MPRMKRYVVLHNIRSAHNVGSVFRTADGAGVFKVYLSGYTPAPLDRFGRVREEIKKTSLGATDIVPYEVWEDGVRLVAHLKEKGIDVVAVEQTRDAVAYDTHPIHTDVAFVFGNEVTGIDAEMLSQCDTHIHIPMMGKKESLNVSVCAGVILFHAVRGG